MSKNVPTKEKTERDLLSDMNEKLDTLIGLIAINGKEENLQIEILKELGHDWKFIGLLTGLKPSTARMRHSARKSNPKKRTSNDKKEPKTEVA